MAGQALVEIANLGQISAARRASVQRVIRGLRHVMRESDLPALERALAGRTLARLGDPRLEVLTSAAMEFCFVPPGPFWMGSKDDPDADSNEQPQDKVQIAYDYWIGRYPVTNAQFGEFAAAGGYCEARYWGEAEAAEYWSPAGFKGRWDDERLQKPRDYGEPENLPNHPVVEVSWYEALAYTRWLGNRLAGQIPAGWRVQLPNEPEWEKAARGGVEIPAQKLMRSAAVGLTDEGTPRMQLNPLERRRYPWGNDPDANRANREESRIGTTSAVGCFAGGAREYGVEELSGNVWEWTRSLMGSIRYPVTASVVATDGARTWRPGLLICGSSEEERIMSIEPTFGAPGAAGSTRTSGTTTSVFGWWCPHDDSGL
ncbi:MAG: SUMF1/EgtB/PvdO family nonheme iron enzyme [Anaerolineae bacterium]|uniref:formylglycine-generating enzyme family protein n=1 Tax=Candidatus Amarolinea dominans TaxID=3140696 RepID=UPI003135DF41|nr:SUMF1/EgtB/PvdO family nonheme iron enzyme [Anaerolineae bacterium]